MFNCKMTEEHTMATAEEPTMATAQRVYAKKLAADRESKKRKRAEEKIIKGKKLKNKGEKQN